MDLKSRKQIQNLPGYVIGKDDDNPLYGGVLNEAVVYGSKPMWQSMGFESEEEFRKYSPAVMNKMNKTNIAGNRANAVISGAAGIYGSISNQLNAVKSGTELLADAGRSNYSVMGVGYQEQNGINRSAELKALDKSGVGNTINSTLSGAQAGASFGPIGAVVGGAVGLVGGLFGWGASKNKLRKRIANAQSFADRSNVMGRSGAVSTALQQDYYSENGNTTGGVLYANRGKDLKKPIYENK